ncbi:MAG: Gfo/Idh/MocA family oxidoreductase [Actinomycetes bacterium]
MPDELRVALVGYGLAGSLFHAPLIAYVPGLRLTTVVARSPAAAARARADLPGVRLLSSLDELIAEATSIDLVVLATPTPDHVSGATRLLDAGLGTIVDKPLAPTAEQAHALVQHSAARGIPLGVFHNRRWDAEMRTLADPELHARLGPLRRVESRFERWRPDTVERGWRVTTSGTGGGGVLLDLGTHLVDQALLLAGPVVAVSAWLARPRTQPGVHTWSEPGAEDDAFVVLEHDSGTVTHLSVGTRVALPGPRLRVLGRDGGVLVADLDGQEQRLRDGWRPGPGQWADQAPPARGEVVDHQGRRVLSGATGNWPGYYEQVRDAVTDDARLPVPGSDAVAVARVLDAARWSAQTGERRALDPPAQLAAPPLAAPRGETPREVRRLAR